MGPTIAHMIRIFRAFELLVKRRLHARITRLHTPLSVFVVCFLFSFFRLSSLSTIPSSLERGGR